MNLKYLLLILLIQFTVVGNGQTKLQSALLIDKQSREHGLNLKDSVKAVRFFYTYFKKDLPEYERSLLYLKNDIRTPFYYAFNQRGLVTAYLLFLKDSINQPIDKNKLSRYKYYYRDVELKKDYKLRRQIYLSYGNFVKLDKVLLAKTEYDENLYRGFEYTAQNNKLIEEKEFVNFTIYGDTLNGEVALGDLMQTKKYFYDDRGNLVKQQFSPGNKEEPGTLTIMDTETPYCDDTRIDYSYDSKDRLTKVVLTSCGKVVESEEYTYHSVKGYISTLRRYIQNPTYSRYPTNNMVAQYNEYGDIVEMHMIVKNDTKPPKTKIKLEPVHRYYEYEYDNHNNWIKCKLYLMGTKEEPTAIAERIIEYYN